MNKTINDDLLLIVNTMKSYDMDNLSVDEINILIANGELTEEDVVWFYNNSQWRDEYE